MTDSRLHMTERLRTDLLGPDAADEILRDRPSDRYLTGILWPRRTEFGADEDEKLASDVAGGDGDDSADEEEAPPAGLHKPAAAGVSFCVASDSDRIDLVVRVTGGTYERFDVDTESTAGSPGTAQDRKTPPIEWRRIAHDFAVSVDPGGAPDRPLDANGLPGFSLYVTQAPLTQGRTVTVRLVNQNEYKPGSREGRRVDEMALFQTGLEIRAVAPARLIRRPVRFAATDPDGKSLALLYRHVREYAVGHTCSAEWETDADGSVKLVRTTWLPEQTVRLVSAGGAPEMQAAIREMIGSLGRDPLSASVLADADGQLESLLRAVPDGYADWIDNRAAEAAGLDEVLEAQAQLHLESCRRSLDRMRAGVSLVERDPQVRAAFRLMNRAMDLQRGWAQSIRAQRDGGGPAAHGSGLRWYPFQLGFILQNLESLSEPAAPDRKVMDLLWFPTGGGKTEAYLGLIAFTAFLRRLRRLDEPDHGGGVSCIMRYTLRLLTLQQFQRASALMLACEYVRRGNGAVRGTPDLSRAADFSVGLWVGGDATPNKLADAVAALNDPQVRTTPRQLTACPCCDQALSWRSANDDIVVSCSNAECDLGAALSSFPIRTVDELVYRDPSPTLLFATIDKFAQIVRSEDTTALFNSGRAPAPDLIIQDELHLISGPLGTLAALYECAIDLICSRDGHPPKVIGSTATIRRADEQISALFDRKASQFPPPGLHIDDSCFAWVPDNAQTRRYVGLSTAGRSAKFTMQAAYASLLQAAAYIPADGQRDGYHTLVGYFNSLRELGGALVLTQDDVPASIEVIAARRDEDVRHAREVVELTSRVSQQDIRSILDQLEVPADRDGTVDILLATNMISVGVDVPRLALMVVVGQPKGVSEYIQATSRVGRSREAPGLVLTILNANKARDRAHYESFVGIHQALYRGVEPSSVTPFAPRARDRALHAAVVAAARHLVPGLRADDAAVISGAQADAIRELAAKIGARAIAIDEPEADATRDDLSEIIRMWTQRAAVVERYWDDHRDRRSLLISAERAAALNRSGISDHRPWPTLNSMRSVETSTLFRLTEKLRDGDTA